jgi:membrane protease YdiL (CAAX protease family)
MDISSIFTFVAALAYVGLTIYLANQEALTGERGGLLRGLLYGVAGLSFLYGLYIFQIPYLPQLPDVQLPQVDATAAAVNLVLTIMLSLFSAQVVASQGFRARLRGLLPAGVAYDPDSPIHTTAWVLMLALVCIVIGGFVGGGGIAGMAQSIQETGVNFGDVLFENVVWLLAAALGVGLLLRRTPQQALARLGLRLPSPQDINWGIGVGILLFMVIIGVSAVWVQLVSPEELQQQTAASDQLAQAFNSLPLAFLISVVVAIGEEIFFRGALQPVFGLWLTSIFFAALHTQYTLTPATIVILITSLALGWLRQRQSTTASIIAHFVYNFIQLALAALFGTSL